MLPSSNYKMGLVLKDTESGKIGMTELRVGVPRFEPEVLNASSIILSREISKVTDPDTDLGPFVLGDVKIVPDFEKKYLVSDPLWVYLQIYNLTIDQNLLRPDVKVDYVVERDGSEYYKYQDLKGSTFRFVSGDRLVITGKLPIKRFAPGNYTLKVRVHDALSGQTLERTEKFEIGA